MGNCVFHVAAQGFLQTLGQVGRNAEMPQWTQGNYEARELAMSRMQSEAERDGGNGVVGVHFAISNYAWGPTRWSSTRPERPCGAVASRRP